MVLKSVSSFRWIAGLAVLALLPACSISFGSSSSSHREMEKEMRSLRAEVSRLHAELAEREAGQASQPQDETLASHYQERAELAIILATSSEDSVAAKQHRKELRTQIDASDQEIKRLQAVGQ
ncbi:MAG: hypothetical protein GY747_12165 [Planctomycetes bacterium]|nr:hypothetical protein [Planctomycetota bacterium]